LLLKRLYGTSTGPGSDTARQRNPPSLFAMSRLLLSSSATPGTHPVDEQDRDFNNPIATMRRLLR